MTSDLRASLRSLVRQRTSSLVIVAILALGIGALAAGWAAVRSVLLEPLPFEDPDRLVRIRMHPLTSEELEWESSVPAIEALRTEATTLAAIEGWGTTAGQMVVRFDEGLERVAGQLVTAGWFDLLGIRPLLGRSFEDADDVTGAPLVVLLSESLWRTRFGADPAILGRTLEVGDEMREIVGVMPRHADLPAGARIWMPLSPAVPPAFLEAPQVAFVNPVARLAEGATAAAAQTEMDAILRRVIHPQVPPAAASRTSVKSLAEELRAPLRVPSLALLAAALLVLLTGAANVGGLLAVRALRQRSELAVRLGLGAGWHHLVRRAALETGLLALAGGIGGAVLAPQILSVLVEKFPKTLFLADAITVDASALALAGLVSSALVLIVATGLALWARLVDASEALRGGGRGLAGSVRHPLLRTLAGMQIALAVVAALAAGLLLRGLEILASTDPGFSGERVLTFQVPLPREIEADRERKDRLQRQLLEELDTLAGVEAAGGVLSRPLYTNVGLDTRVTIEGRSDDEPEDLLVNLVPISSSWLDASGMRLLQGRGFDGSESTDTPGVVLLTRSLAQRLWPDAAPVGRRLKWGGPKSPQPWLEVVGIVDDVRWRSIEEPTPTAFIPFEQSPGWGINHLAVHTEGDPWLRLEAVREVVRRHLPGSEPLDVATLSQMVDKALAGRTFVAVVVTALAVTSLVLAALGLYGLLTFLVTLRRTETGVRMALGASPRWILREILGDSVRLTAFGVGLGLAAGGIAAAAFDARFAPHLGGLSVFDPLTFAAVAVLVVAIGMVAGWLPAHRASRCDPATVLRDD